MASAAAMVCRSGCRSIGNSARDSTSVMRHSFAWDNRDGRCIATRPRGEAVSGRIWVDSAMFQGSVMVYSLAYPGNYKHSGKPCKKWWRVTEAEYDRQMYCD